MTRVTPTRTTAQEYQLGAAPGGAGGWAAFTGTPRRARSWRRKAPHLRGGARYLPQVEDDGNLAAASSMLMIFV